MIFKLVFKLVLPGPNSEPLSSLAIVPRLRLPVRIMEEEESLTKQKGGCVCVQIRNPLFIVRLQRISGFPPTLKQLATSVPHGAPTSPRTHIHCTRVLSPPREGRVTADALFFPIKD